MITKIEGIMNAKMINITMTEGLETTSMEIIAKKEDRTSEEMVKEMIAEIKGEIINMTRTDPKEITPEIGHLVPNMKTPKI
jgi:thiamine biosynthesis protein ThiC